MASVFSYYLARSFSLEKWASVLSGITFMFCGFMVTHAMHETMIIQFTYMPLIFMFYNKSLSICKLRHILLTGLFMGIAILCGHPQVTLYMFFIFLLFGLYQIFFKFKENNYKIDISLFKFITIASIPFIIGIMLGSIQLLPSMRLAELSVRAEITYEQSSEGSLNYHHLFTLFSPKFFGQSGAIRESVKYWGHGEEGPNFYYWESCIYVGLLALIFGMLGIIILWKKRIVKFLAAISLFSMLFALGDNFIFHKFFYNFVPMFDSFRFPSRFVALVLPFSFSLLGAYGFDYFIKNTDSEKIKKFIKYFIILVSGFILLWLLYQVGLFKGIARAYQDEKVYDNSTVQLLKTVITLLVLFGLVILYKKKIIFQQVILLLFILLSFVDLYIFGSQQNNSPDGPDKLYGEHRELVKKIKQVYHNELFRIQTRTKENILYFGQNQGMLDFIFMLDGYSPLNLKYKFPAFRTNELMNVKFFVVIDTTRGIRFILNEGCVPRAWISYYPIIENSQERVAEILEDPTFDIVRKVIIDQEPEVHINKALMGGGTARNQIMFKSYDINEIALSVETSENGILVLSEVYYPNWKVFVDGVEKPMLRCYYSLRGVAIEKGKHTVIFKYVDRDFQLGVVITLFALAIVMGGFVIDRYKTRKDS
jgi:hypothetical protein